MHKIPIFLSADNNYAPFVATTIASICDNTKSFCDFYILDGGITKENQDKICELKKQFDNFSIEFIDIDIKKYFKDFKENMHFSKTMYSRFLIPDLKPDIDKAIYSDVDVIVLGDIAEMYNEDLGEYALGAVWEEINEFKRNIKSKQTLELSNNHKYFSSGNLLIDCKKWRENNVLANFIEIEKKYHAYLELPDQDILNKNFDNNYKILSPRYCFCNSYDKFYNNTDVVIRHFEGLLKPWYIAQQDKDFELSNLFDFWEYAKMTEFYYDLLLKTKDVELKNKMKRYQVIQRIVTRK